MPGGAAALFDGRLQSLADGIAVPGPWGYSMKAMLHAPFGALLKTLRVRLAIVLVAPLLGVSASHAAVLTYTGTTYAGWYDEEGLFGGGEHSSAQSVTAVFTFDPTSINSGYYAFDNVAVKITIGSAVYTGSLSVPNSYWDSEGLCCGGTPAFNTSFGNSYFDGVNLSNDHFSAGGSEGDFNFNRTTQSGTLVCQGINCSFTSFTERQTQFSAHDGSYSFQATASSDAPEPASWAMLVAGFGLTGGALRTRRKSAMSLRVA